eukprot:SM005900S19192  [mRNA]  locus=s5900:2:865:- [translate_table: standard]
MAPAAPAGVVACNNTYWAKNCDRFPQGYRSSTRLYEVFGYTFHSRCGSDISGSFLGCLGATGDDDHYASLGRTCVTAYLSACNGGFGKSPSDVVSSCQSSCNDDDNARRCTADLQAYIDAGQKKCTAAPPPPPPPSYTFPPVPPSGGITACNHTYWRDHGDHFPSGYSFSTRLKDGNFGLSPDSVVSACKSSCGDRTSASRCKGTLDGYINVGSKNCAAS